MKLKILPKRYCRELSKTVPNDVLLKLILRAMDEVPDWTKPSRANKGLTRAVNWNYFCKDFDVDEKYSPVRKYRILEEFGEYISDEYKPVPKAKREAPSTVAHFEPDFSKFKNK